MRSVVIHLADTTRAAVRERLSEFAGPANGDEWRYPPGSSTPVLYIGFYEDYEREFDPDELRPLQTALGKMPDVIVIASVSGRRTGDAEVRQCVECLLDTFHGDVLDQDTQFVHEQMHDADVHLDNGRVTSQEPGRANPIQTLLN